MVERGMDEEGGVDAATDQRCFSHSTVLEIVSIRARSFDHQLSFSIVRDSVAKRFAFIRVLQEDMSAITDPRHQKNQGRKEISDISLTELKLCEGREGMKKLCVS